MIMKKTIYFLAALALVGCAKTDEQGAVMSFSVAMNSDWTSASAQGPTRGTPVASEAEMTDFGLFCAYTAGADWTTDAPLNKMFNEKMIKSGSPAGSYDYWTYAGGSPVRWQTGAGASGDDRYTFFAYAPYATASNGLTVNASSLGIPTLSYTVPTDNALQPDLMVAVGRENIRPSGNPVAMHMTHALTAVGFEVNGNDQISTITLTGFSTTGILSIDGRAIQWHSLSAPTTTNYTATNYTATTGWLMMIPQTLTTAASVTITFSNGTPSRTISLAERQWLPGKRVTYTVNI